MTTLRSGAASLVGQVRGANEDSYLVTDDLVAVADGMGGHRAGEVASADTVDVLREAAGSRSVQDLVAAVHRANRRIHERAADDDALRGMGTTVCVAGLVRYDDREQVAVLNVGDSRAYLMADGELTRLTEFTLGSCHAGLPPFQSKIGNIPGGRCLSFCHGHRSSANAARR